MARISIGILFSTSSRRGGCEGLLPLGDFWKGCEAPSVRLGGFSKASVAWPRAASHHDFSGISRARGFSTAAAASAAATASAGKTSTSNSTVAPASAPQTSAKALPSAPRSLAPIVVAGPSGAGKSTLIRQLLFHHPQHFEYAVSHTTRKPRPGEVDGTHYHFVPEKQMKELIAQGHFLEHVLYANHHYGTSYEAVRKVFDRRRVCLLDIDLHGLKTIRQSVAAMARAEAAGAEKPEETLPREWRFFFIVPPSFESLRTRLELRGESLESVERRLKIAEKELSFVRAHEDWFEAIITNDLRERAYSELESIIFTGEPKTATAKTGSSNSHR